MPKPDQATTPPQAPLDHQTGSVDLRACKAHAQQVYPAGHPVRETLANEPDFVPHDQGKGKLLMLLNLVYATRK